MKSPKKPKAIEKPEPAKIPKRSADPVIGGENPLSWRFSHRDMGGPFGWRQVTSEEIQTVIIRFSELESMTWDKIIATKSHPIACEKLCDDARARLVDIGKNDFDELMSFRVNGTLRVWCIHDNSIMRVLWWDPNHQVYPTLPDKEDRKKIRNRK